MKMVGKQRGECLTPLEAFTVTEITVAPGDSIVINDGQGRPYVHQGAETTVQGVVVGATGYHIVTHHDAQGEVKDRLIFPVQATTQINDAGGFYTELLQMLYYTKCRESENMSIRYKNRIYHFFVCWLRDHVHEMKGFKYFFPHLKDAIDLYHSSQREDGMIWDNVYPRTPEPNYWDMRFREGDFIRPFDDYSGEFRRIPVENDVEYLFVEGLYYTWKAVGDEAWMASILDAAIRALDYTIQSPYRWSEQYQLLKRGYTIDTWDFLAEEDRIINHDAMLIDPEKTHFGVMFGDNTGYAVACDYLGEMLDAVGRHDDATRFRQRGQGIRKRLDALSWNGHFFTHHIPEHPERKRDLGVDESQQLSLSNAYSLNRGISHEQCAAIIESYRALKDQLPPGSPGEWYLMYPPFQKGFGGHSELWQYVNGGVSVVVAGELAHGAFEHGFERYGADILQRVHGLGKQFGGLYHTCYTGSIPEPPVRNFHPIDLSSFATIDVAGTGADGVPGWTGEGDNDLHEAPSGLQTLVDIPFLIPDPATNGRRAAIGLQRRPGYAQEVIIPIGRPAASLYFLHTCAQAAPGGVSGRITLQYADGTSFVRHVMRGYNVQGWWFPQEGDRKLAQITRVAWRGKNAHCLNVGLLAYGLDHPHPEREITSLTLTAAEDGAFWAVLGLTLCDQPVFFPISPLSHGLPPAWGAAAVISALIEGLAGVVDKDVAYQQVAVSPRWSATDIDQVDVTVTYPESGGYVAYRYQHDAQQQRITLELTGSGEVCHLHILLPDHADEIIPATDGVQKLEVTLSQIEQSYYADCSVQLNGLHRITIYYNIEKGRNDANV